MIEELKKPLILIASGILLFFILSKLFGPIPFTVTSVAKNDVFSADGVGESQGIPEEARISLGITAKGKTVEEVRNQTNTVSNKLTDELKKIGIEEKSIKTSSYNIYPEYTRDFISPTLYPIAMDSVSTPESGISGYTANITIEVTADTIEKANKAIDSATKLGINQIGGVQFVISDETREKLTDKAREDAINKAKEKAQRIAKSAGIKLGKVINIYEYPVGAQDAFQYDEKSAIGSTDPAQTDLNPGESTIKVNVSLVYEIR